MTNENKPLTAGFNSVVPDLALRHPMTQETADLRQQVLPIVPEVAAMSRGHRWWQRLLSHLAHR